MKISRDKHFDDYDTLVMLFGGLDGNVERIEDAFNVKIFTGSSVMKITGEEKDVLDAISAIDAIATLSKKDTLTTTQICMVIELQQLFMIMLSAWYLQLKRQHLMWLLQDLNIPMITCRELLRRNILRIIPKYVILMITLVE